ncbi:DUF998 domain-containing protein [Actinoplanes sp. TBRC 11911]|uniref:DUF998 domain-containing protein n=1 Tax=Actinoplanes sp. TBRC 11911 TaxID=2729386 RepID=UPI00145FB599|nr:DUF998 domain-containing protein [Actinoplanes sp. TBRC 11911]NMO56951.1 DUF998 domain-containing protein [Actinoplanes sp. TBRC 11911]
MGERRWLLAGGAIAAVQMVVFVTVVGDLRPGYDADRNWVSQLSLGPGGWLASVNFAVCGILVVLCGLGLGAARTPGRAATWAVRLVVCSGSCLVGIAVVPTDPGIGYPPDVPAADTLVGLLHKIISVALGGAGIAAAVLLGRYLGSWARAAGLAVATVMAAAFVTGSVLVLLDAGGVLPGAPSGLLERVALYAGLGWTGTVAVVLLARGARTTSTRTRRAAGGHV